jgi:hypothetical protein
MESSNNLLNAFFVGFVKFGTCVTWVSSLIVLLSCPYLIGFGLYGQCCSFVGCGCSYRSNCLAT